VSSTINRRRFDRYQLSPMYTPVGIRVEGVDDVVFEGHAYDVCEGGLQFELDVGIKPGTAVHVQLTFPATVAGDAGATGTGRSVFATGNVVWLDESEPGPVRMAVAITKFAEETDRARLVRVVSSGRLAKAA